MDLLLPLVPVVPDHDKFPVTVGHTIGSFNRKIITRLPCCAFIIREIDLRGHLGGGRNKLPVAVGYLEVRSRIDELHSIDRRPRFAVIRRIGYPVVSQTSGKVSVAVCYAPDGIFINRGTSNQRPCQRPASAVPVVEAEPPSGGEA
ncbi:MAG: hypothetical protein LBB98_13185, partial [Treponema sp.]|nr:hypothetical protein [Treponema sp.]